MTKLQILRQLQSDLDITYHALHRDAHHLVADNELELAQRQLDKADGVELAIRRIHDLIIECDGL